MQALANVLNLLLEGLLFIAYACAMGGLVWSLLLLRPWGHDALTEHRLVRRSMALLRWGALGIAVAQLARLFMHAWLLSETFQRSPLPAFLHTLPCQADLTRAFLAGGLAAMGMWVERRPKGLLPPEAAALYPVPFDEETTLTSVVFTQFLAKWFGLYLGKLDTFSGDANAFAHEWKTQFMNTGFGPSPMTFRTVPYSTLGAGFLLLPTESVLFNFSALSPDGTADSAGFDELYEDGVVLAGELRVGIKPFGLPGHQLIGGTWSSKTFNTLQQDPRLLLTFLGLPLDVPIRQQSGSWSAYYNFDQFVYTTTADGSEGVGIFGRIGVADPTTNPLELSYSFGIGGQGMLPGRARDRFGLGFYYARLSRDLRGLLLDSSAWGMELFYNIAVTNWLFVTPDIQVFEPAAKQASTAFLTGLRVQMRF